MSAPGRRCRLRLFVTGGSLYSRRALVTIAELTRRMPDLHCEGEVIDLLEQPERAGLERIMATPTLIRLEPEPARRIVGDLRDADSLMSVLELDLPPDGMPGLTTEGAG